MMRNSKKLLVCGLMAVLATSGLGAFAQGLEQPAQKNTLSQTTTRAISSAKPLPTEIPNTPGTLFVDGQKDFKLTFNEKMEVTGVTQLDLPGLSFDTLKGKSVSVVLAELKKNIIQPENTELAKLPIVFGMGSDIKSEKQLKDIQANLVTVFNNQSLLTMNLDDVSTEKTKVAGTTHLSELYQAHVESMVNIKGLTKEQYESILKSEKLMALIGLDHAGIAYKKANENQFDSASGIEVLKPVKPSDDDDDDDDDEDDDEDDDDDNDK